MQLQALTDAVVQRPLLYAVVSRQNRLEGHRLVKVVQAADGIHFFTSSYQFKLAGEFSPNVIPRDLEWHWMQYNHQTILKITNMSEHPISIAQVKITKV